MDSKINCTCGWSWNKSDSSKKDMYICHECGKDNNILQAQAGKKIKLKEDRDIITESTSVYKKPFNNKELKNILKDNEELNKTGDIKKPSAEANKFEKFLPNKKTIDFFKQIKKQAGPEIFREALQIQQENGNPSINVGTEKGLPLHKRRNYNLFSNEINIPAAQSELYENQIYDYLKEVSHSGQPMSEVIPQFLWNDVPAYAKAYLSKGNTNDNINKYVYNTPGTVENYTHNVVEPKLKSRIDNVFNFSEQKNGGWLDSYQEGGEIPQAQQGKKVKYVESKNDPRYKAYQDSLSLYKESIKDPSYEGDWKTNGYKENFIEPYNRLAKLNGKNPKPITSKTRAVGDSYFQYKKPTEPIIVTKQEKKDIINPIQNTQPIGIQNAGLKVEAPVPEIKQKIVQPKYYDVEDTTQGSTNYINGQTNYRTDDLSSLSEQTPNNTRKVIPHYQMGGSISSTIIQKDLTDSQVKQINDLTGMNFELEFAQKYFMTEEESKLKDIQRQQQVSNAALQHTNKIIDITSESPGAFSNKRIWHDKRPEQYINKEELIEGKQYTTIPYSQWADYQKSPQYMKYKNIPPTNTVASMQQGGIIKDDNGYWNPDNWGSPVEIGSNNITMEGVYEPLLGISDTGDTKLMKPGKNYKFKGKKVTEYPMAKNGLRQEQKGLKNLNDLTNFTNYNKPNKKGWLDNY